MNSKFMTTLAAGSIIACSLLSAAASAADAKRPPDPCDRKEISSGDLQAILKGTPTINHYSMSEMKPGDGCAMGISTHGMAMVDISIGEGHGQSFQNLLSLMPKSRLPVPGVGDEAYGAPTAESNIPNSMETDLYARKGKLQCVAQLHRSKGDGEKLVIPVSDSAIASRLGALCNKLFAAQGGR